MNTKDSSQSQYSLTGLHLPEQKILTGRLEKVSFILNDFVLAISAISLLAWFVPAAAFLKNVAGGFFLFPPMTAIMFMLAGTSLLFKAKYYLPNLDNEQKIDSNTLIPILLSVMTAFFGIAGIFDIFGRSQIHPMVGFTFFLFGLGLILPHIKVAHRFHITQLLTYWILVLSFLNILGYVYGLLFTPLASPLIPIPLNISLFSALFCHSILFRWSNRGFCGNFTTDSLISMFALRLLIINILLIPSIGFIALAITQNQYNRYTVMALLILLLMVLSTILAWFNIKMLYRYELEHFALQEALRVHNIKLKLDKRSQEVKLVALEETEKEYRTKLDYQDKFRSIADSLG